MTKEQAVILVRKAQRGNRAAVEELIVGKQRQILFVSYTKLGNIHDAEEVMQESMIDVFRHIGSLKTPESFDAWLNRIIICNCHKQRKKYNVLKTETDVEEAALEIPEEAVDFIPEEYAEKEELRREVYDVVMSLPEVRRDTILMYYYEDMSLKEIAAATGIAEATAASNISRARKMMKDRFGMLSQKGRPVYGAASSTTLGRILQRVAISIAPDDRLFALNKNWLNATSKMKFAPKKAPVFNNVAAIAACTVLATSVLSAAVILNSADEGESAATQPTVTQTIVTQAAVTQPTVTQSTDEGNQRILFSGSDCDCGHINPREVTIGDPQDGDVEPAWTIENSETGEIVFSGDTDATNAVLTALSEQKEEGRYVIHSVFSNIAGYTTELDRSFIIGNYHEDI
jgi:RNA polymerase sigma factor (sigma-70 family)